MSELGVECGMVYNVSYQIRKQNGVGVIDWVSVFSFTEEAAETTALHYLKNKHPEGDGYYDYHVSIVASTPCLIGWRGKEKIVRAAICCVCTACGAKRDFPPETDLKSIDWQCPNCFPDSRPSDGMSSSDVSVSYGGHSNERPN